MYDHTPILHDTDGIARHSALGPCQWYCRHLAVLRKESLIGDGLSHAALPGVVIAFLLTGIKDIEVLIIGAALSSITAAWLITITVENSKIKFDGALATILSAFFGLGMVLLTYLQSLNNAGQAGLSKFIFGQAATILARDVYITSAAALIIIVLTALFWKELSSSPST